ncbi:MAG TPA: type II secretion system protein [Planctomycetota bacterium]|nr:type II secretion system protein [Planctomycetota bacterium]
MRVRTAAGLTLLEVMIAISIIGVTLLGTMNAWVNSQRLQYLQQEESIVQAAISQTINDMRALPFDQIDNSQYPDPSSTDQRPGYSGGRYDPYDLTSQRLLPGTKKLYLGWTRKGTPTDASLRGLKVLPTKFDGAVQFGDRWAAYEPNTAEMRIILINTETPTEARMGETPSSPSDGIDLNGDGRISEVPLTKVQDVDFGQVDAKAIFPRYLATPVPANGRDFLPGYLNCTSLIVYPAVVQVRWWSAAGIPRELSVITFFTNRAGTKEAAPDTFVQ